MKEERKGKDGRKKGESRRGEVRSDKNQMRPTLEAQKLHLQLGIATIRS